MGVIMENKEYKELKLPEEMTKEERKELKRDIDLSAPIEEADKEVHGLIYNTLCFISFVFFAVFFSGMGIIALLQEDLDKDTKVIASIFALSGIFILYKAFQYAKSMKRNITGMKKEKTAVITLRNIGFFVYGLAFVTGMSIFILMFVNPESELLTTKYHLLIITIVVEAALGTIIMFVDTIISMIRGKDTKIFEIKAKK